MGEVQANESKKFLNLFPKVTILEGGVASGFRNVKPKDYKPRLLHVTVFKKHVQVYQVKLAAENLNNSDSFVLDCGLTLFQFNGTKSSAWEKRKANAIVYELQASRHGKVKTTLIIDGLEDGGNPLIDDFWAYFGGSLFIWIGKGANKAERREAMNYGVRYLTDQGRGSDVPMVRVSEGKEPKEFWDAFAGKAVSGRASANKQWKK